MPKEERCPQIVLQSLVAGRELNNSKCEFSPMGEEGEAKVG